MKHEIKITFTRATRFTPEVRVERKCDQARRRVRFSEDLRAPRVVRLLTIRTIHFRRRGTYPSWQIPQSEYPARIATASLISSKRSLQSSHSRGRSPTLFRHLAVGVKTSEDAAHAHKRFQKILSAQKAPLEPAWKRD